MSFYNIFTLIIFICGVGVTSANPELNSPLINLTAIMVKDAMYKLRMADLIRTDYKYTIGYELGLIAAGIMERFKHMLQIYKYCTDIKPYKTHRDLLDYILFYYQIMQSDYNEIRLERDLFNQVNIHHTTKGRQAELDLQDMMRIMPSLSIKKIIEIRDKGLGNADSGRRAMIEKKIFSEFETDPEIDDIISKVKTGVKKNNKNSTNWTKRSNMADEEYKKMLRYMSWAEQWKGFNPEVEGVDIPDHVAQVGLRNASNFLLKELKGII